MGTHSIKWFRFSFLVLVILKIKYNSRSKLKRARLTKVTKYENVLTALLFDQIRKYFIFNEEKKEVIHKEKDRTYIVTIHWVTFAFHILHKKSKVKELPQIVTRIKWWHCTFVQNTNTLVLFV